MLEPTSRTYNDGGTHVRFTHLPGGYLVYQCLRTAAAFKSVNYAPHEFTASNGIRIVSKNSPTLFHEETLFLQGGFPDFDLKPAVMHVGTRFDEIVNRLIAALTEFTATVHEPGYTPRVVKNKAE